jgi:hypothetical protein
MIEATASNTSESGEKKALEAFVVNNPDLERLEGLLATFNVFEALGAARQELRHSDFLAFLLNPSGPHGLGDLFLTRLLKNALVSAPTGMTLPVSPIELDVWSLEDLTILREWQNIDILILDEDHRFIVAIENKIGSHEHSDQLARYRQIIDANYRGWRHIFLYLTPEGDQPSEDAYIPISYDLISEILQDLASTRRTILGDEVTSAIRQYTEMLRRYILADSDIADLCRQIYRKHQQALDLIYEHRPDIQSMVFDRLVSLAEAEPGIRLDHSSKGYVRYVPERWDVPELKVGKGGTNTGRMLLFEFANAPELLKLKLIIGPGPEEIREQLFQLACQGASASLQDLFKIAQR